MQADAELLEVRDLTIAFPAGEMPLLAADRVAFSVKAGRTLGLVGESGCGKSVTLRSLLGMVPYPGEVLAGEIRWQGEDLRVASRKRLAALRGREISMVFQDPTSCLNPVFTIGDQMGETLRKRAGMGKAQARRRAVELLDRVGVPSPERRLRAYPHPLSGGMRQRVMIAIAIAAEPQLLLADEPTTALDVTTQAQILDLMKRLQSEFGSAIIMITHDLGVVAEVADDVVVMYAARVQEEGEVHDLFQRPNHPYTWGLLGSLPRMHQEVERLVQISGQPPSLLNPPRGCRFHPRCPYVMPICKETEPELAPVPKSQSYHRVRCYLDQETKDREGTKVLEGQLAEVG